MKSGLNRASSALRELCCSPRHCPSVGYRRGAFRRSAQARIFELHSIKTIKVGFLLSFKLTDFHDDDDFFFELHEIKGVRTTQSKYI